eukprot:CAMPEP_0202374310 /NCGR_PEP_ID=MMETSP1127-20130417/5157_1 /ASSEMBLY_ACC=CAM_ASM_000462 /TAXON_ID=3047 /ORGANISM="Dunaliella tertiolecta, Strain CCMP1320" /LENGTH=332 /DNA_ID=CAMNT_0048971445 /DNA_START=1558 /DNA_END=2556 /DNA_ORIENTATION=+
MHADQPTSCSNGTDPLTSPGTIPLPLHAPGPLCTFDWQPLDQLSTEENLLDLAVVLARNSKREGGHMGCVLARPNGDLLALSVNSSLYDPYSHKSDVHAEANAVCAAARKGLKLEGAAAYITMPPCRSCFGLLQAAGISRIITRHATMHEDMKEAAARLGISMASPWDNQADLQSQQRARDVWNNYAQKHPEFLAQEREQAKLQKQQVKQQKALHVQQKQQQQQQPQRQQVVDGEQGSRKKKRKQEAPVDKKDTESMQPSQPSNQQEQPQPEKKSHQQHPQADPALQQQQQQQQQQQLPSHPHEASLQQQLLCDQTLKEQQCISLAGNQTCS